MLASSLPTKFPIPFANNAVPTNTNPIPQASQIGVVTGAASLVDGFPPVTFVPVGAGGTPPWGRDFNGLFNQISAWTRFADCAGGLPLFDATFSSAIGGYPQGALIAAVSGVTVGSPQGGTHLWMSTVDNNTVNPDVVFNTANWVPVPAVINTTVTYTVHGSTPQFADLVAATEYLRQFTITRSGKVILQLAGAASGVAQAFTYNAKNVVFEHPQNNHIFVQGATMLGAVPTNHGGYTLGSRFTQPADIAANLAMLRTRFATELSLINGSAIEITGTALGLFDAVLITGNKSTSIPIQISCSNNELNLLFPTGATSGVAIVGAGSAANFYVGQCGNSSTSGGLGFPIVSIGSGGDGFQVNAGGRFQPEGVCLSYSNTANGFDVINSSWMFFDSAGCESIYNGGHGVVASALSNAYVVSSNLWGNAGWGTVALSSSHIDASGTNTSGVSNVSGDSASLYGSFTFVTGQTSTFNFSPAIDTIGNSNSMVVGL